MVTTRLLVIVIGAVLGFSELPASGSAPELRPTRLTVRASALEVLVTTPVTLTGRVSGDRRRVELELRDAQGWRRIDTTRADRQGGYSFVAPTSWYGKKRLRVVAPPTPTRAAAKARVSLRVLPEYAPHGDRDDWRNNDGRRRYNPCEPVLYAVNPALLPADGMAVLQEAVFRIERASGLRYRYVGSTDAVPFRSTNGRTSHRKAHLTVAWSTSAETPALDGNLGVAGYLRERWIPERRTYLLRKTGVTLNAEVPSPSRMFEDGAALGVTHLYLLGIAMGLGPVNAPDQVMYRKTSKAGATQFGRGDLTGLAMHGLDQGCLEPHPSARITTTAGGPARRFLAARQAGVLAASEFPRRTSPRG